MREWKPTKMFGDEDAFALLQSKMGTRGDTYTDYAATQAAALADQQASDYAAKAAADQAAVLARAAAYAKKTGIDWKGHSTGSAAGKATAAAIASMQKAAIDAVRPHTDAPVITKVVGPGLVWHPAKSVAMTPAPHPMSVAAITPELQHHTSWWHRLLRALHIEVAGEHHHGHYGHRQHNHQGPHVRDRYYDPYVDSDDGTYGGFG